MFSLHITKSTFIFHPSSVEIHRPIASSLEHGPAPSVVHVAPDGEGLPTPWVYGVHSWPSAAQDIGLLAVKGEGVQVANYRRRWKKALQWHSFVSVIGLRRMVKWQWYTEVPIQYLVWHMSVCQLTLPICQLLCIEVYVHISHPVESYYST